MLSYNPLISNIVIFPIKIEIYHCDSFKLKSWYFFSLQRVIQSKTWEEFYCLYIYIWTGHQASGM